MTEKKKLFCEKLIECHFNQTKAAIEAGFSAKSARSKASQLLQDAEVQKYLSELKTGIRDEFKINAKSIVEDFESIRNGNVADIFDIVGGEVILRKGIKKLSDLPPEITKNIKSIKSTANGIAVEMYCRDAALTNLAKIAGLYIEKVEVSGDMNLIINGITKV